MNKDIRVIREECCDIWNNLKDKTKMIDYLIESKQRIADLEVELAVKDKAIANWRYMYEGVMQSCHNGIEENKRLEKLLEEKDEDLIIKCRTIGVLVDKNEQANKDKISFAVEQLEKVKNEIYGSEVKFEEIEKLPIALNNYEIGYDKGRFKATNIIDNQIKQLKEVNK